MAVSERDSDYEEKIREILSSNVAGMTSTAPARLLPNLYLGSQRHAESLRLLRRMNIDHVLNCAAYRKPQQLAANENPYQEFGIDYYEFPAKDYDEYNITIHFREAFAFLERVLSRGGTVLVHCAMGINRSAAVCVGYLMKYRDMNLLDAVDFVKSQRRVILSNAGFRSQLVKYARSIGRLDKLQKPVRQRSNPGDYEKFDHDIRRLYKNLFHEKSDDTDSQRSASSRMSEKDDGQRRKAITNYSRERLEAEDNTRRGFRGKEDIVEKVLRELGLDDSIPETSEERSPSEYSDYESSRSESSEGGPTGLYALGHNNGLPFSASRSRSEYIHPENFRSVSCDNRSVKSEGSKTDQFGDSILTKMYDQVLNRERH